MKYEIASISLIGDREVNEDFAAYTMLDGSGILAVVCDGLGGHKLGEWASRSFAEGIIAGAADTPTQAVLSREEAKAHFYQAFIRGRNNIGYKLALENSEEDPKTTAVVVALLDQGVGIAHLGDSRAYRLATGADAWRTRDHSVVQMLLDEGEVTEEEMGQHPDQGKLFKSISARKDDKPAVTVQPPLRAGEAVLLCTDGFWEQVNANERQSLLGCDDLQASVERLAWAATERAGGTSDNVSAICIRSLAGRR